MSSKRMNARIVILFKGWQSTRINVNSYVANITMLHSQADVVVSCMFAYVFLSQW